MPRHCQCPFRRNGRVYLDYKGTTAVQAQAARDTLINVGFGRVYSDYKAARPESVPSMPRHYHRRRRASNRGGAATGCYIQIHIHTHSPPASDRHYHRRRRASNRGGAATGCYIQIHIHTHSTPASDRHYHRRRRASVTQLQGQIGEDSRVFRLSCSAYWKPTAVQPHQAQGLPHVRMYTYISMSIYTHAHTQTSPRPPACP